MSFVTALDSGLADHCEHVFFLRLERQHARLISHGSATTLGRTVYEVWALCQTVSVTCLTLGLHACASLADLSL